MVAEKIWLNSLSFTFSWLIGIRRFCWGVFVCVCVCPQYLYCIVIWNHYYAMPMPVNSKIRRERVKTSATTPRLFFKALLFATEGLNVAIHVGHFLPRTIFYKPFREDLSLPFPVVWPGLSCRERGTAKPKCRCTTWQALGGVSWPDKRRERNTAIYLYSLWFCVLRPRLPDPGWIFRLRMKTDGWLSIDILKATVRINVRSICVNRVWGFDVWSTPLCSPLTPSSFLFSNKML